MMTLVVVNDVVFKNPEYSVIVDVNARDVWLCDGIELRWAMMVTWW